MEYNNQLYDMSLEYMEDLDEDISIYLQSKERLDTILTRRMAPIYYDDPTPSPIVSTPIALFSLSDRKYDGIINTYKNNMKRYWNLEKKSIYVEWANIHLTLDCYTLPDNQKGMTALTWQGDKYQYDTGTSLRSSRTRVTAWKIPFLNHPSFTIEDRKDGYFVSHLCHNTQCYNWNHHVFETLPINKSRNGCPGLGRCCHKDKCIRPGPYHNQ